MKKCLPVNFTFKFIYQLHVVNSVKKMFFGSKFVKAFFILLFCFLFFPSVKVSADSGVYNLCGHPVNFPYYRANNTIFNQNCGSAGRCFSNGYGSAGSCEATSNNPNEKITVHLYTCTGDTGPPEQCHGGNGGVLERNQLVGPEGLSFDAVANFRDFCKVQLDYIDPFSNGSNFIVYKNEANCSNPPPPTTKKLTVTKNGTGSGQVTSSGGDINCGSNCSHDYAAGTSVTLFANADASNSFTGWSGCNSTSGNQCTVGMDSDKTVIATFNPVTNNTLTIVKAGTGASLSTVISSGPPIEINCGLDCNGSYLPNTTAYVDAKPGSGVTFTGWTSCDFTVASPDGAGLRCGTNMTSNRTLTANFQGETEPPSCGAWSFTGTDSVTVNSSASDNVGISKAALYISKNSNGTPGNWQAIISKDYNPSQPNITITGTVDLSSFANGTYLFASNWWDVTGNPYTQCTKSYVKNVDKEPPQVAITEGPTDVCIDSKAVYKIFAADNVGLERVTLTHSLTTLPPAWKSPMLLDITGITRTYYQNDYIEVPFYKAAGYAAGQSYYLAAGAFDDAGNKCSGNPFLFPSPPKAGASGWADCGNRSRKTVNIIGGPTPPVITNVTNNRINSIVIYWDHVADRNGYNIYRDGVYLTTVSRTSSYFIDTTASCDTDHRYSVSTHSMTNVCQPELSSPKSGSCISDTPTVCDAWSFSMAIENASGVDYEVLNVTARAQDANDFDEVIIKRYSGGGSGFLYWGAPTVTYEPLPVGARGVALGKWYIPQYLPDGTYNIDATWIDKGRNRTTCDATYDIVRTSLSAAIEVPTPASGCSSTTLPCVGLNYTKYYSDLKYPIKAEINYSQSSDIDYAWSASTGSFPLGVTSGTLSSPFPKSVTSYWQIGTAPNQILNSVITVNANDSGSETATDTRTIVTQSPIADFKMELKYLTRTVGPTETDADFCEDAFFNSNDSNLKKFTTGNDDKSAYVGLTSQPSSTDNYTYTAKDQNGAGKIGGYVVEKSNPASYILKVTPDIKDTPYKVVCIKDLDTGTVRVSSSEMSVDIEREDLRNFRAVMAIVPVKPWFQAVGGNIFAKSPTDYTYPSDSNTVQTYFKTRLFNLSNETSANYTVPVSEVTYTGVENKFVISNNSIKVNGADAAGLVSKGGSYVSWCPGCGYKLANYILYLKNNLTASTLANFIDLGDTSGFAYKYSGTTVTGANFASPKFSTGSGSVFVLAGGNLTISGNITKPSTDSTSIVIVVPGNLTISKNVTRLDVTFLVGGHIDILGETGVNVEKDLPLVVNGSLNTVSGINLPRSTLRKLFSETPVNKHFANSRPVETFIFQPEIFLGKSPSEANEVNLYLNSND